MGALALGCSPSELLTPSPTTSPRPTNSASPTPTPSPTAAPLPLRQRAARMLLVGFGGRQLKPDAAILRAIAEEGIGGVILFERNIESPDQLAELTATLRAAAAARTLLIAVDQEGGAVARLGPEHGFPTTPRAAQVGQVGDPGHALAVGREIAAMLAAAGINLNLAPVVDLDVNPDNPSIGALGRSYSADPDAVVEMAGAFIRGHREQAVLTTLKHFPGLGSATGDTDREFVDVSATWSETELEPYRQLIGAGLVDLVMAANALNGQVDARNPASLSATTHDVLRDELGWDGVVITDDLGAGALRDNYSQDDILRLAISAGNDLLLLAITVRRPTDIVPGTLDTIVRLVEDGELDETMLDRAGARLVALLG